MSIGNGFNAINGALTYFKSAKAFVVSAFTWGTATAKNWGETTSQNWG
jgi:hypothetical protein